MLDEKTLENVDMDIEVDYEALKSGDSGLDILVDFAKRGEINPWDIDLEKVTEKYLRAISESSGETLREAGRAIFYASVLLRLKSDILANEAQDALHLGESHDDFSDMLEEELEDVKQVSFRDLERVLRRRNITKIKRFRRLTLEDLVAALQGAQQEEEQRAIRRSQQKLSLIEGFDVVEPELADDISELTHAENMEEALQRARAFVAEYLLDEKGVSFAELVKVLGSWSNAFLAVCYLGHEHEVEIEQGEIYGDLYLHESEKTKG